jgi:phage-related minor tail protein
MALNVGELVARVRTDNSELESGLAEGEQSAQAFGDKFGAIMAAAGAAAALALGAALVGALNQQQVGGKLAAQLGQTSKEAGAYGRLAGEVYAAGFGESVSAVGDALSAVARSGLSDPANTDALKSLTEQAMTLSDVFGYDVTESARAASQMVRTGLAANAKEAFDVIAFGAQNGVDKAEDLLDTFNEYSTQFRKLGIDAKTSLGLMSQGLKAGARDSDTVADSLKEFAIRAVDGSSTTADGYKSLGLSAKQMAADMSAGGARAATGLQTVLDRLRAVKDPAERSRIAVELFGTKAEDLGSALYALDPRTAIAGMDNLAGATDRAGEAMYNNASSNLETFKRKLEEGAVNVIGGKVIPAFESFVGWLGKAGDWITKNKEGIGPLLVFLGTFAGIILVIVAAMKVWAIVTAAYTAVQMALNAAMLANPIGLIIIAVIALVAAIVWLWYNSSSFRDFFIGLWNGIKTAAMAVANWFAGPFANFFVGIWNGIVDGAKKLWIGLQIIWAGIVDGFNWLKNGASNVFNAIKNVIVGAFNGAVGMVKGAINNMIGLVNGAIRGINAITSAANKIPGVNIGQLPQIPKLAGGGVVHPSAGGRPVIMGDGGQIEYGVPRDDMRAIIREAVAAGAGSGGGVLRIVIEGTGLLKGLRRTARVQGGNTQTVYVGS